MRTFTLSGHLASDPEPGTSGKLVWTTLHIEASDAQGRPRRFFVKLIALGAHLIAESHRAGERVLARGALEVDAAGSLQLIAHNLEFSGESR